MEIYEKIKNLDFFKRQCGNFDIFEFSENEYVIKYENNKKYTIKLFPIEKYGSVLDKKNKIDTLILKGRNLYPILETGTFDEYKFCYRITDNIVKIEKLDSDIDNYKLGYYIGETIKEYHNLSHLVTDQKWETSYTHKISYIFHEYGLCEYIGEKDYILLDYVKENNHLIFDRDTIEIFSFNDIRDIPVDENGKIYLFGTQSIFTADPYFEFKDININYYKYEAYSAGLIDGYFSGKPNRLFFKTIALYTIIENLGKEFKYKNKIDCSVVTLKMEELASYYDDFNDIYPKWYIEIKEKIMEK